jgi:hypothetical protein
MIISIKNKTCQWEIQKGLFQRNWQVYLLLTSPGNPQWEKQRVWMAAFRDLSHVNLYVNVFEPPPAARTPLQEALDATVAQFRAGEIGATEFEETAMVYSATREWCAEIIAEVNAGILE